MPPVIITTEQRSDADDILDDFNTIVRDGATDSGTVDDFVVSKSRAQQYAATTPPTPLRLPLDPDPSIPDNSKVFSQVADNGMLPIFLGLLRHLSGKLTTDKILVETRSNYSVSVSMGNTFVTLSAVGQFPHSTGPTETGVPVDSSSEAAYAEILDAATNGPLTVNSGPDTGKRIFGRTRVGGSTSPDSVEVEFRAKAIGAAPTGSSNAYTWESGQPTTIIIHYGFRQTVDQLDETGFRRVFQ